MLFFSKCRNKEIEAQRWILKLLNNHCPELAELNHSSRLETRVALTLPAWVVPWEHDAPQIARAFPVVTKEFSPSGLSLVINRPFAADRVLVGFQWPPDEKRFLHALVRHVNPLGAGFSQMGVQLTELVCEAEYPELNVLNF